MINIFDLYTDYLQVALGLATATNLSKIVANDVSHDQITRMFGNLECSNKNLWKIVKPLVRQHELQEFTIIL